MDSLLCSFLTPALLFGSDHEFIPLKQFQLAWVVFSAGLSCLTVEWLGQCSQVLGKRVVYPGSAGELLDWLTLHLLCVSVFSRSLEGAVSSCHLHCGFCAWAAGEGREHCRVPSQLPGLAAVLSHRPERRRWHRDRKEGMPFGAVTGAKLCECQSLLCSRWGMLECVLISQQCMWAAAHSGEPWASDSPCFTESQGVQRSDCSLYQWYSYRST